VKYFKHISLIFPVFCLIFAACGGSAIGDAQEFSPNEPPSIISIKAVNFDGTEITQLDIEPYKQFKLIIEAIDPDNNPLEYKFDSASGTFAGISSNSNGCTAVFKTGSIKGGQNIELWAGVSDGKGALVRQSFNLGTGKLGPTIIASFEKIRFRPVDKIKLSVRANCSGFFQLYCDGTANFDYEKDMYRYSYSENKTTDFILAGPNCTSYADIVLESKTQYNNDTSYNLVLVFRDGLFQENSFTQPVWIDGMPPEIKTFSPSDTGASTDPEVIVDFTENIGYADSSSLTLDPAGGKIKLKRINLNQAVFSVSGLETSQKYIATVSGIKDIAGNVMASDSTKTFTTRSDPNAKMIVTDSNGNNDYTAYCGFENVNSTISLYVGPDDGSIDLSSLVFEIDQKWSGVVSVDESGLLTVKTKTYLPEEENKVENVTVTAKILSTGEHAEFIVTIEPWYPVTKANEFGQGGIIDQNLSGRFKLMNEINFGAATITPIGAYNASGAFKGIFDGDGKTLKNFNISSGDSAGIFSFNKGIITKLKIKNASINVSTKNSGIISGYNWGVSETKGLIGDCELDGVNISVDINGSDNCGAVAGRNYGGKIINCIVSNVEIDAAYSGGIVGVNNNWDGQTAEIAGCNVDNADIKGNIYCGGLAGTNLGDIKYSPFNSGIVKTQNEYCGGIAGLMTGGTIEGCSSAGTVEGTNYVGGIVGSVLITRNGDHSIANCNYKGKSISGQNYVGGLIGSIGFNEDFGNNVSLTIDGCSTEGDVYVEGTSNVGGLIGYVYGNSSGIEGKGSVIITNSHVRLNIDDGTADIKGVTNVGGLIGGAEGQVVNAVNITLCLAIGNISCNGNLPFGKYAGGLIGNLYGYENTINCVIVSKCFSKGTVLSQQGYVGGLIGSMGNSGVYNCYSSSDIFGPLYLGGLVGSTGICRIDNCYALGDVPDINATSGGLIGVHENYSNAQVNNCFRVINNGNSSNGFSDNNYGITETEVNLRKKNTYSDWTFPDPWNIDTGQIINNGYPYLMGVGGQ